MDHVTGIIDPDETLIAKRVEARLFIGPYGLVALFAFDKEHGAVYAAEKFDRLK